MIILGSLESALWTSY